jgi:hypothetical protein
MAVRTLRVRGRAEELHSFLKALLGEIGFHLLSEEVEESWFRITAVDRKRMSQLAYTLLSLIGGLIPRKRWGVEFLAVEEGGALTIELRSTPYLDTLDIELRTEGDEERRCRRILEFFQRRIMEEFQPEVGLHGLDEPHTSG